VGRKSFIGGGRKTILKINIALVEKIKKIKKLKKKQAHPSH